MGYSTVMKFNHSGFDEFIASQPTPEAFRQQFPAILLVTPGMITTCDMRGDQSRYFAKLNEKGTIIGGSFS